MINILDDFYESDLTEEEHERLILMSEHAVAPPLSPAAQAVFHAFNSKFDWVDDGVPGPQFEAIAAAIRTAAEQRGELEIPFAVIDDWEKIEGSCASFYAAAEWGYKQALKDQSMIADELDAL